MAGSETGLWRLVVCWSARESLRVTGFRGRRQDSKVVPLGIRKKLKPRTPKRAWSADVYALSATRPAACSFTTMGLLKGSECGSPNPNPRLVETAHSRSPHPFNFPDQNGHSGSATLEQEERKGEDKHMRESTNCE